MKVYLDASVLVALFTKDALALRADTLLRTHEPMVIVGDFAAAEFAPAAARRVRMGEIAEASARGLFATFDAWTARVARRADTTAADVVAAAANLRRLDLTLRTPDALNIAIAHRLDAVLATFDRKMATAARALGTTVLME